MVSDSLAGEVKPSYVLVSGYKVIPVVPRSSSVSFKVKFVVFFSEPPPIFCCQCFTVYLVSKLKAHLAAYSLLPVLPKGIETDVCSVEPFDPTHPRKTYPALVGLVKENVGVITLYASGFDETLPPSRL